jgi:hypothetical protein
LSIGENGDAHPRFGQRRRTCFLKDARPVDRDQQIELAVNLADAKRFGADGRNLAFAS